jgi:SAM-dependent methyltransferase
LPRTPTPRSTRPAGPAPAFADVYDRVVGRDFWHHWWRAFRRAVGAHGIRYRSVCDVACGTGEMALRFAREGARVFATDLSEDMLRVARAKCEGTGVLLARQPMQELAVPEPADLLVCAYDALNHLDGVEALEATFRRFAAALAPGGHAVCDLATLRHLARDWGTGTFRAMSDGMESIWQTVWYPDRRRATIHLTVIVPRRAGGPARVTQRVVEYGFTVAEIEAAIAGAGLAILEARDMIPWTPAGEGSERLFYVLRKPVTCAAA